MKSEVHEMDLPGQGEQTLCVEESCRRLNEYLKDILRDAGQAHLDLEQLSPSFRTLGESLRSFQALAEELSIYTTHLSRGELSQPLPESDSCLYGGLKDLHANLKHLTWQAKQVADGDYTQHAAYLGEFSAAFNLMTQQLRQREIQLTQELEKGRRRAGIIESYIEMLVELLGQRDEWLLVVDQATREISYCNKRVQSGGEGSAFCHSCRNRLAIQPRVLEWNGQERYQVWEMEDRDKGGGCYRIISFPVEWEERPSSVHIIIDITAEKMNARHLSDDIYQDAETGIRNRLFLDEFMGQALRERQDITLCYLDLEGVSDINSSLGREAGDAYIQNFVEIVRKNFRSGDTFARIQGDKFCLMLTGNVKHLIERKMDEVLTVFQRHDDRVFSGHCSFKYSILNVEGEVNTLTVDELLQKAETEVKRKKRKEKKRQNQKQYDPFQFQDW